MCVLKQKEREGSAAFDLSHKRVAYTFQPQRESYSLSLRKTPASSITWPLEMLVAIFPT